MSAGSFIMTFDVVEVKKNEIRLTGNSGQDYRVKTDNKKWLKTAKKTDVVAIDINEFIEVGSKMIIDAKSLVNYFSSDFQEMVVKATSNG